MTDKPILTSGMVARALAAYKHAGGGDDERMRAALEAMLDHGTFAVGDEVVCQHGPLVGVIIEIHDDQAVVSWSHRGKSFEPISALDHVEHLPPQD